MTKQDNPSPDEIKKARTSAGHTQTEAATLIGYTLRAWQMWEAGDRPMRRSVLDLYLMKAGRVGRKRTNQ